MSILGRIFGIADAPIAASVGPDYECTCGCRDFTAGGPTVRASSAGVMAQGQLLCCLACGDRWYSTPSGLRHPHESAMPPAWAAMDLQARAAKAQSEAVAARMRTRTEAPRPEAVPVRAPHRGFRTPPTPTD